LDIKSIQASFTEPSKSYYMFLEKYKSFQRFVRDRIPVAGKKPISEEAFDQFIATILANDSLDIPGKIYCRDGFACVNELDRHSFQILEFL